MLKITSHPPTQDLDKAFATYRGAYHIGSNFWSQKEKGAGKKIKEQEIERFK